ncbi:MAG: peroxide stress protein YaaA [Candidatus Cyclobacteriaceae bacterium M3_2C_046]
MIIILSPAKTLDFDRKVDFATSATRFDKETKQLIQVLKKKSGKEVKSLMSLSDNLAHLNLERYQQFQTTSLASAETQPALFAFQGDVYQGLESNTFNQSDVDYAQEHLRILSGLYGLLRPLDLIQPYRLEMGTKLKVKNHPHLYSFWGDKITKLLQKDLDDQQDDLLVNLASREYFKAVNTRKLKAKVIEVEFKDFKNDQYKIISFYAKKARGMMAKFIIKNKVQSVDDLKLFHADGYEFDVRASDQDKLAFKRG